MCDNGNYDVRISYSIVGLLRIIDIINHCNIVTIPNVYTLIEQKMPFSKMFAVCKY